MPNDISSAAFFMVAGVLLPDSVIELPNIGVNPTRNGIVRTLQLMGANIQVDNRRDVGGEPEGDDYCADVIVEGDRTSYEWIPTMIDEIPILALAASQAIGRTVHSWCCRFA